MVESMENQQQVFHPSHRPWKSATTADSHIPTASTTTLSYIRRSNLKPDLKPLTTRVGQIKLPKWAKCSCQTHWAFVDRGEFASGKGLMDTATGNFMEEPFRSVKPRYSVQCALLFCGRRCTRRA